MSVTRKKVNYTPTEDFDGVCTSVELVDNQQFGGEQYLLKISRLDKNGEILQPTEDRPHTEVNVYISKPKGATETVVSDKSALSKYLDWVEKAVPASMAENTVTAQLKCLIGKKIVWTPAVISKDYYNRETGEVTKAKARTVPAQLVM